MLSQKLEILRGLIDNEIMLQRAETLGLMAVDADVETKLNELKAPYTQEEFQKQLQTKKLTVEGLGFKDVKSPYDRLPGRAEGVVPPVMPHRRAGSSAARTSVRHSMRTGQTAQVRFATATAGASSQVSTG